MLVDQLSAYYARIKNCIYCDKPVYAIVSILNIKRTKMDFSSPSAEAAFVICLTLTFESTNF